MNWKNNIGKIDRAVRLIVGLLLLSNVFIGIQNPVGWIGILLVITAVIGNCPIYTLFKFNTSSMSEKLGIK